MTVMRVKLRKVKMVRVKIRTKTMIEDNGVKSKGDDEEGKDGETDKRWC